MLPNLVELMATDPKRSIAIIGGGLCGLSLAMALKKRSIPFKIYEARSSFVEQGTGINISPNARQAFRLIDEPLGDAVERLVTRNPPPKGDVWMHVRFGAGTTNFADGELVDEMLAPPTGSTTDETICLACWLSVPDWRTPHSIRNSQASSRPSQALL